jgi:hypothetical protein
MVRAHGSQKELPRDTAVVSLQQLCLDPSNNVLDEICASRRCNTSTSTVDIVLSTTVVSGFKSIFGGISVVDKEEVAVLLSCATIFGGDVAKVVSCVLLVV